MYADDVIVYVSNNDPLEAIGQLQSDINHIHQWCETNHMTVNTDKSSVMTFGSKTKLGQCPEPVIKMGGQILPVVTTYPYLGVDLDGPLTVTPFVNKTKKNMGNRLYKLKDMRGYLPEDICLTIYKTMIMPVPDYCSFYLGSAHQYELTKIQRLQNRGIRICTKTAIRGTSVADLHSTNNVPILETRRKHQLVQQMWKLARKGHATQNPRGRTRGDLKLKFRERIPKSAFYQKSPYYRGTILWNDLDHEVQKIEQKDAFKQKIKEKWNDKPP